MLVALSPPYNAQPCSLGFTDFQGKQVSGWMGIAEWSAAGCVAQRQIAAGSPLQFFG